MNLGGRSVLLTGATGGIGGAVARALAARGASVVLTGRRAEPLEALAAELGGRAPSPPTSPTPDAPARLLAEAGDVDVLVANAGAPRQRRARRRSRPRRSTARSTVNLRAPIQLARLLAPAHVARGGRASRLRLLAVGPDAPGRTRRSTRRRSSACAGSRSGCARTSRAARRRRVVRVPRLRARRGHVRRLGRDAPAAASARARRSEVAAGIVRAIERDRGEVDVAPLAMKAGARIGGLAPGLTAAVQGRLGSFKVARAIGAGQRDKR